MSPNTRLVTLVRVRLKSFLCKYYFSRMSKFHSSFSLDFFLAKFPKHISFSKQSWQEGVTPSPSCSCNRLGVQLPTVTSFLVSKPTSSCSCCWGRVGRREHEKGAHTQREELVHSLAEAGAPLSWSLGESHSINRHSLTVCCVLGTELNARQRPCLQGSFPVRGTDYPMSAKATQQQKTHLFLS